MLKQISILIYEVWLWGLKEVGEKNIWRKRKRLAGTSVLDALLEVKFLKDWNWHSASLLENAARAIFLLHGKLYKEVYWENMSWIWKVGAWPTLTHLVLPGSLCSSANKDLREPSSVREPAPFDPYLISPGRRPSALAWPLHSGPLLFPTQNGLVLLNGLYFF